MPKGSRSAAEIIGAVEITLLSLLFIHSLLLLLLCIHCYSDSQKHLQQARIDVSMKTITFQVYEKTIRTINFRQRFKFKM